jgi:hypothetical protein
VIGCGQVQDLRDGVAALNRRIGATRGPHRPGLPPPGAGPEQALPRRAGMTTCAPPWTISSSPQPSPPCPAARPGPAHHRAAECGTGGTPAADHPAAPARRAARRRQLRGDLALTRPALSVRPARQLISHPGFLTAPLPLSRSRRATTSAGSGGQDAWHLLPDLGAYSAEHRATAVGCHDPVSPNQPIKPARLCIRTCLPIRRLHPDQPDHRPGWSGTLPLGDLPAARNPPRGATARAARDPASSEHLMPPWCYLAAPDVSIA